MPKGVVTATLIGSRRHAGTALARAAVAVLQVADAAPLSMRRAFRDVSSPQQIVQQTFNRSNLRTHVICRIQIFASIRHELTVRRVVDRFDALDPSGDAWVTVPDVLDELVFFI